MTYCGSIYITARNIREIFFHKCIEILCLSRENIHILDLVRIIKFMSTFNFFFKSCSNFLLNNEYFVDINYKIVM